MLPLFLLGLGLFATSRISAITVKMSDFSLSLEDIDLLINGKIPLIISKPGRLMQPTKFCTMLFWRSAGAIRNRLLIHKSPFHAVVQLYFGDPPGRSETHSLFTGYVFTQIYKYISTKKECMQTKRVTSSTTYFSLRF